MRAGAGINGSKVKAVGVTLTGTVMVGMGVSATEKKGDQPNTAIPFSLSRSLSLGIGMGEEFSLFSVGAEIGPFTAGVQGPTAMATTDLTFSFGDSHSFNDALNLSEQDRYAIMLFAIEPSVRMRGSFWLNKMYEVAQKKLVGRPRLTSQSLGVSAKINTSFSLVEAALALERKKPEGSSGGGGDPGGGDPGTGDPTKDDAPAVGFKLDVKGSASESMGLGISRGIGTHTLGFSGSFGGAFGLEAELNLPAGLTLARQSAAAALAENGALTSDQRNQQLAAITLVNGLLSDKLGGSLGIGGSISVGTTTADYTDLANVPVGTSLLPQQLDLGFSVEGNWGWKAEGGLPAQNREHGQSFSFAYSAAAPDIKKKALTAFNFFRAGLYPAQKQELGVPAVERITLQPTSLFDDLGRFLLSILPDSTFSVSREIGTGISFPLGLQPSSRAREARSRRRPSRSTSPWATRTTRAC